jgi:hypothetical protein
MKDGYILAPGQDPIIQMSFERRGQRAGTHNFHPCASAHARVRALKLILTLTRIRTHTYAHTHTHAHTLTCAHPFAGTTQAVAAPPKVAPRTAPKEWSTQDVSKVALKDVPLKSLYPDEPSPPKPVSTPPLLQSAFLLHDLQGRIIAACKVGYPSGPCKQLGLSSAVLEQGPTLTTLWAREPGPTDGLYPFAFSLQPLFLSLDMHLAHPIALAGRSQDACGHCGQWPGRAVHCSGAA